MPRLRESGATFAERKATALIITLPTAVIASASFAVGWVEHGNPVSGALREPVQNIGERSQGFDSVRNPPFPGRFAPRTLRSAGTASRWQAYDQG